MNWAPLWSLAIGGLLGFAVSWGSVKATLKGFRTELDGMRHFGEDLAVLKASVTSFSQEIDRFRDSVSKISDRIEEVQRDVYTDVRQVNGRPRRKVK